MKKLLKLTYVLLVTLPLNSISQIVNQTPSINVTKLNVSCYGSNDGYITTSVVGGQPPYTYIWNGVVDGHSMDNLTTGIYNLKVIDDLGSYNERSIEITQPEELRILGVVTQPSSFSSMDGGITVSIQGGTPFKWTPVPYDFEWSNNSQNLNLNNISSGSYTLTVKDYNGCVTSQTFKIKGQLPVVSPVNEIEFNNLEIKSNVYPNPAIKGQDVNITYNKSLVTYIFIISETGSIIKFSTLNENGELVVNNLEPGGYYVKFFNGKTLVDSYRLIVH
jgi:hypothetical protein